MSNGDVSTVTIGKDILPFDYSDLPEFYKSKAATELNDTPDSRTQGLMQIKEMVESEKSMKNTYFSDDFLLLFLRTKKFNATRAFSKLKAFVAFKKHNPDLFRNFCFESTLKTVTHKVASMLPYRCQDGCAILLVQIENWLPDLFTFEEVKQMYLVLLMQSSRNILTQVTGFKVILDFKSNLKHLPYCTPQNVYLLYHATQVCLPSRYKSIHVVNESLTLKAVWMIIKYMLPEKLKKRIFFHSSEETLLNFFPKEVLPVHYGGTLTHVDMTPWLRKVMQPEELRSMLGEKCSDSNSTT